MHHSVNRHSTVYGLIFKRSKLKDFFIRSGLTRRFMGYVGSTDREMHEHTLSNHQMGVTIFMDRSTNKRG
jgi:hypothetical protein